MIALYKHIYFDGTTVILTQNVHMKLGQFVSTAHGTNEMRASAFDCMFVRCPAQGSFITPTQDAATAAALVELRTGLRTVLRAAWSREAVRRGIGLARQGSHAEALECYDQVHLLYVSVSFCTISYSPSWLQACMCIAQDCKAHLRGQRCWGLSAACNEVASGCHTHG